MKYVRTREHVLHQCSEKENPINFNPKVSIIIPVYNGSNYLREAINSALSQTYNNVEVIVVNDGSNDEGKTEEIAKSYGDRIRYFYKENGGVPSALNLGIRNMSGEYFSALAHDDLYYPKKIGTQIDFLRTQKCKDLVLYSDYDFIDYLSKKTGTRRIEHIEPDKFIFSLLINHPINGCTMLIPKSCFDLVGLFNENLVTTHDYEMWFRLARKYRVIHIPEVLAQYRIHAEQYSVITASVHSNEENNFFKWYIKEVSFGSTDNSLPTYLLRTAIYLKKIGFAEASKHAFDYALERISNNILLWIKNMVLIINYRICDSVTMRLIRHIVTLIKYILTRF